VTPVGSWRDIWLPTGRRILSSWAFREAVSRWRPRSREPWAPTWTSSSLASSARRIPRIGSAIKLLVARAYLRRRPFVALPNIRAQRHIMPELVGDFTPDQVAEEGARLLQDGDARRRIIEDLMGIPDETGASRRILAAIDPFQAAA